MYTRILKVAFVLIMIMTGFNSPQSQQRSAENTVMVTIIKLYQIPSDEKERSSNSEVSYSMHTKGKDSITTELCVFTRRELQPLMLKWHLKNPEEMVGHTIACPTKGTMYKVLEIENLKMHHHGNYTSPPKETIYKLAVKEFATGHIPVFRNDVDQRTLRNAFSQVFPGNSPDPTWMNDFKKQVTLKSNGKRKLQESNGSSFHTRVHGKAGYLILTEPNGSQQKIIFTPSETQFVSDDE